MVTSRAPDSIDRRLAKVSPRSSTWRALTCSWLESVTDAPEAGRMITSSVEVLLASLARLVSV